MRYRVIKKKKKSPVFYTCRMCLTPPLAVLLHRDLHLDVDLDIHFRFTHRHSVSIHFPPSSTLILRGHMSLTCRRTRLTLTTLSSDGTMLFWFPRLSRKFERRGQINLGSGVGQNRAGGILLLHGRGTGKIEGRASAWNEQRRCHVIMVASEMTLSTQYLSRPPGWIGNLCNVFTIGYGRA